MPDELKSLPSTLTKQKAYKMYHRVGETYLRKTIQWIQIEHNPHLPEEVAKRRHKLNSREIVKLVEVMGVPDGYKHEFQ